MSVPHSIADESEFQSHSHAISAISDGYCFTSRKPPQDSQPLPTVSHACSVSQLSCNLTIFIVKLSLYFRNPVYIQGVEKNVEIMPSLQHPKKITLRGTDGRLYGILCKPSDDLRKDSKVMEMNHIVNWYLARNPEGAKVFIFFYMLFAFHILPCERT